MDDEEIARRAGRIQNLYASGTLKTPEKLKMLELLVNPTPPVDFLNKVSSQYGNQVILDRTKATALTKKSVLTSVKALSNEIFLNVSFKFVKMTKNKRVYADMVIQPCVTNYLTKKFSFKGSAKFKDVRTILIDHAESQWFIFYRNNELPEHHNWLVTDSKGMGFDFETVADFSPKTPK